MVHHIYQAMNYDCRVMSYARVNGPREEYRINNEAAPFIVILFRGDSFDYIIK